MKKLLYLLLAITFIGCSYEFDDSTLKITNDTNEDFIFTQISFRGDGGDYKFSNLNLQYGESQEFNLGNRLNSLTTVTTMPVYITYVCSSQEWALPQKTVNFDEGSLTTIILTYETDCGLPQGGIGDSEYCTSVCLSYCCDT